MRGRSTREFVARYEEERGQSETEVFLLLLDKVTETVKITRPNACPSATTDAPDHEERIAGLQRELAVLTLTHFSNH